MQKEVSRPVLIGVAVVLLLVAIFLGSRVLAPHPPPVTIPDASMMNEGAAKRKNIEAAKQKAGQAPGGGAAAPAVDRTGD